MTTKIIDKYLQELYVQEFFERFTTRHLKVVSDVFNTNNPEFINKRLSFIPKYNSHALYSLGKKRIPEFEKQYRFFYKRVSKNEEINRGIAILKTSVNSLHKMVDEKPLQQQLQELQKALTISLTSFSLAALLAKIVALFAKVLGLASVVIATGGAAVIMGKIALLLFIVIAIVWLIRLSLEEKK